MSKEEENDQDEQMHHLNLNNILDLDTSPLKPPAKELEDQNDNEIEGEAYSRFNNQSEIELKKALDILKSLQPNEELVTAINLIEKAIKREKII